MLYAEGYWCTSLVQSPLLGQSALFRSLLWKEVTDTQWFPVTTPGLCQALAPSVLCSVSWSLCQNRCMGLILSYCTFLYLLNLTGFRFRRCLKYIISFSGFHFHFLCLSWGLLSGLFQKLSDWWINCFFLLLIVDLCIWTYDFSEVRIWLPCTWIMAKLKSHFQCGLHCGFLPALHSVLHTPLCKCKTTINALRAPFGSSLF